MSNLIENLKWRYATKLFDPSLKISEEDLNELLDVLRLTPSSFGLQPWKFIVVESMAVREKIQAISWNQKQVTEASHLIVLARQAEMTHDDVERFLTSIVKVRQVAPDSLEGYGAMMKSFVGARDDKARASWMKDQVYIALGFLLFGCAQKRIDSCPMEGFDSAKCDAILGLEELGLKSVVLCPVGYRSVEDHWGSTPKVRYGSEDVVLRV